MKSLHVPACLLSAISLLALAACSPKAPSAGQVAIRVNGDEVSVHQVDLVLQARTAAMPDAAASAATPAVLAALVDSELAAQAARREGLDRDPRVIQQLEVARRQVLAQAYQERVGLRAAEPSSDEIDRYYDEHPELFARRRLYQLQETVVRVPVAQFAELKRALEAVASPVAVQDWLAKQRFKTAVRQVSISAEDLPLQVLSQLSQMKDLESLVLPHDGGARVISLLGTQAAPLDLEVSRRLIGQYLINERKRALFAESMKTLRDDAKVEYLGRYAAVAASAPAPAAQASGPDAR